MKQHITLLAKVPDIDVILAVRSLFPWDGTFHEDQPDGLRTLNGEQDDTREMFVADTVDPIMRTTMNGDDIEFTLDATAAKPDGLAELLMAMGLQEHGRSGDHIRLAVTHTGAKKRDDNQGAAERIYDRLLDLDSTWCLIRRLKAFGADQDKTQQSAQTVLEFNAKWAQARLDLFNSDVDFDSLDNPDNDTATKRLAKRIHELLGEARRCTEWGVAGLQAVTLHYDPRGSSIGLRFEDGHEISIAQMQLNWDTGRAMHTANPSQKPKRGKYDVRPTRVPSDVLGVLNGLVISGHEAKIIERLNPRLYAKVNEFLSTIGGQWRTAQQAHVFEQDPRALIETLILTGECYTAKDFELFVTPPALVEMLIREADIKPGMLVLEPEAGWGALAMAAAEIVGKVNVTCHELMPENVKKLVALGFALDGPQDFLSITPEPKYDRICMNPPFSSGKDVAHIRHAMGFLKPGGVLTAYASTSWQTHDTSGSKSFQAYVAKLGGQVKQIPAGAFKTSGTDVPTTLLKLTRPMQREQAPKVLQIKPERQELQVELF